MSKKQLAKALADHEERERAKNAARLVVPGYPGSHNPYLPHKPMTDCYSGCIHDWDAQS